MKTYNIGGSPETQAPKSSMRAKVLKAASSKFGFGMELEHFDLGGDRYLKTGRACDR